MDAIYIYDGNFVTGEGGFPLIRRAAARHCLELSRSFDAAGARILRKEKGKPYFADSPLEFSLTHSGSLWMCLFSDDPCGLDLQVMRDCEEEKLARRWFLPEEAEEVVRGGREAFFRIWTRKEAFCKMTGQGLLGQVMPSVLEDKGIWEDREYYFSEIEISEDMKCALCTLHQPDVQLRILG